MTRKLRLFQYATITSVWGFDIAATMTQFQSKGFSGIAGSTQLFVSASLIAFISTTFLLYGLRILRRLKAMEKLELPMAGEEVPYQDSETIMMSVNNRPAAVHKPTMRIYKVMFLAEFISIVTMSGQVSLCY